MIQFNVKKGIFGKSSKIRNRDGLWGLVFLAPITIGMALFVLFPIIYAVYISFHKYDLFNAPKYVGVYYYKRLFNTAVETQFWQSLENIAIFAIILTILSVAVGLVLASILTRTKRGGGVFKAIFYIPMICSVVATTSIWSWMYNDAYGPIAKMLAYLGFKDYKFFAPAHVMPSMIFMCLWGGFGGAMLLYFAGLKNIPNDLYEAASIDGASQITAFFRITVPMVSPTTFYLLLTGLIGNLQAYSQFLSIGLVGYTPVLIIYSYAGHGNGLVFGYASAMGVFYGLMVGFIAFLNFKLSKYWVGYDV